jgi:hypothetical protein
VHFKRLDIFRAFIGKGRSVSVRPPLSCQARKRRICYAGNANKTIEPKSGRPFSTSRRRTRKNGSAAGSSIEVYSRQLYPRQWRNRLRLDSGALPLPFPPPFPALGRRKQPIRNRARLTGDLSSLKIKPAVGKQVADPDRGRRIARKARVRLSDQRERTKWTHVRPPPPMHWQTL